MAATLATAPTAPPIDRAKVEGEERSAIEAYCEKHDINGMIQGLVEGLLTDRPETHPKEHFAHLLRMDILRKSMRGRISDQELYEAGKASAVPGRRLVSLFEATKKITAEIVPKETIDIIIQETIKLLNCDRVSLFIYDRKLDMLVLNASNLDVPIRVKPGQGLAGACFQTQEVVNIMDCYNDQRFDQTFDISTGYRTCNLICMPIVDYEGESMGVLQAINKIDAAHFSHVDEILMENLTMQCSIALRNAEVYRAAIVTSERAQALLHMIQSLSQDLGVQSTILTVTTNASELVQADRCTVFLVDESKQQLWSVSTDDGKEIQIPKSAGIAGECATEGKLIVIPDAYEDPRFNPMMDRRTGYVTKSIMAVPVRRRFSNTHGPNSVVAVIQMINKMEFDGAIGKFDDEDVQVMETFATFVASKLEGSSLLSQRNETRPSDEASAAFGSMGPAHGQGLGHAEVEVSASRTAGARRSMGGIGHGLGLFSAGVQEADEEEEEG